MTPQTARRRAVSLNGADNTGKTTAITWLAAAAPRIAHTGRLDDWHPGWAQVAGPQFARWWFADSSTAEHVELVMASHQARRAAHTTAAVVWEDRGEPMLLATCAATAMVKEQWGAAAALETVTGLAAAWPAEPRDDLHVLLRHTAGGPTAEAEHALARDAQPPGPWYAAYQRALAEILELQVAVGVYDLVLVRGADPVLAVQRRIRAALAGRGVDVRPLPKTAPERVWALGGLSESGKSTTGTLLAAEHGAARLKIGWLLELAALRAGVPDPYAWPEPVQAAHLAEEILSYCAANKTRTVAIESVHRDASARILRELLGEICQLVYLDAGLADRAARTDETAAALADRDAVKTARGANQLAEHADIVLDNSGPAWALKLALPAITTTAAADPPTGWEPETSAGWLARVREHLVDERTALLLATGTTGTARWRSDWSDLDLLLVADTFPLSWLRSVPGALPDPGGVKVGLTLLMTDEVAGGRIPPRVVHALRAAADGTGILYRRPGYRPPCPAADVDDRAARGELGLVLMTTRRLLAAGSPDLRALHKHLVLLAKLLLRANGTDLDDADEVLVAFLDRHPQIAPGAAANGRGGRLAVDAVAKLAATSRPDPAAVDYLLGAVAATVALVDTLTTTALRRTP